MSEGSSSRGCTPGRRGAGRQAWAAPRQLHARRASKQATRKAAAPVMLAWLRASRQQTNARAACSYPGYGGSFAAHGKGYDLLPRGVHTVRQLPCGPSAHAWNCKLLCPNRPVNPTHGGQRIARRGCPATHARSVRRGVVTQCCVGAMCGDSEDAPQHQPLNSTASSRDPHAAGPRPGQSWPHGAEGSSTKSSPLSRREGKRRSQLPPNNNSLQAPAAASCIPRQGLVGLVRLARGGPARPRPYATSSAHAVCSTASSVVPWLMSGISSLVSHSLGRTILHLTSRLLLIAEILLAVHGDAAAAWDMAGARVPQRQRP